MQEQLNQLHQMLLILFKVLDFEKCNDLKKHLNINQDSKILLFNTEGDTDPDSFKKIVSEFN